MGLRPVVRPSVRAVTPTNASINSNRRVAIVGIGSVGANGDATSSYLFRKREDEAARAHLAKRMQVDPQELIGHHGIRTADPTFMDFDPRAVTIWREKQLANHGYLTFEGMRVKRGGPPVTEERNFTPHETIRVAETERFPVSFAGQMPAGWNWKTVAGFQRRRFKNMGEASKMACFASAEAVYNLGHNWNEVMGPDAVSDDMIGTYVGSGIGANDRHREMKIHPWLGEKVSTFTLAEAIPDTPGSHVGMLWGLAGVYCQVVGACATAGLSVYEAVHAILRGGQLMAFAGGVDAALTYDSYAGFLAATALVDDAFLEKHNLTPQQASRAFNVIRGGFTMGVGGGVLLLADSEVARQKGWEILGWVAGVGNRGDGYQAGLPNPGPGIGLAMDEAFEQAQASHGVTADDISFYNAHGTSTGQNDPNEAKHLQSFLERHGRNPDKPVPVTAQKEDDGHTLGGAGGKAKVETVQILRDGTIPGLRNLDEVDPEIAANQLLHFSREHSQVQGRAGMGGTLGFGHHNATWIFVPGTEEEFRRIYSASEWTAYQQRRQDNAQKEADFRGPLESGEQKLWDILPEPSRK